jgi:hypothetical protein
MKDEYDTNPNFEVTWERRTKATARIQVAGTRSQIEKHHGVVALLKCWVLVDALVMYDKLPVVQ